MSETVETIASACDGLRRDERGTLDVARIREERAHLAALRRELAALHLDLRRREAEFAARREDYLRARSERKVLAALKVRRLSRHERAVGRAEQAEMDDVARLNDILRKTGS